MSTRCQTGFTTFELVITIVTVLILGFLLFSIITATRLKHRLVHQLQQDQQIYASLRHFAADHEGKFPGARS